jgi:hypothetical protein
MRRSGLSIPSRVNGGATAKTYSYSVCYVRNISTPPKRTIHQNSFRTGFGGVRLFALYQSITYGPMFY